MSVNSVIISSIPLTLVFIMSVAYQNWIVPEANFEILLDYPWTDLSIDSQTSVNLSLVDKSPFLRHYTYDIALAADRLGGDGLPPGVKVELDPAISKCGTQTTMSIETDSSVTPGAYTLRVTGYGADGTMRNSFLVLDVHE
jgi:hypothetical protein